MRHTLAFTLVILAALALALPISAAPPPPPPAIKLSVTSVSSNQVGLAWSGRFPATGGFKIERSTDQNIFIQIAVAYATNYLDTGLIPNTTYFYRVRSFSDARYSNLVQVQTPGPAAPLSLVQWGNSLTDPPDNLGQLVALAAGNNHQLALKTDGSVIGWGDDFSVWSMTPTNLTNVVAIAAGGSHGLALKHDGTVVGWGHNDYLQATPPPDLNKVAGIAGGGNHSLALKANGTVIGWGNNSSGQAQPPAKLNHVVAIAAGGTHSLALKDNGTVVGWGDNSSGQTQPPPHLTNVVAIAAGRSHSLALKGDGTVVVWGYSPPPPPNLTGVVAIAAAADHNFALKSDGTVVRWGYDGIGGPVLLPLTPDLVGVTAIAAGANNSLALSILPGTPHRLTARIAAANEVDLSWHDNSDNEDSFIIERTIDPGFYGFPISQWIQIATVGAGVSHYEDTSVTTNLTYRYRVSAHNQFGSSPPSIPVIVNLYPPAAPIWQMTALGSTNQIDLVWSLSWYLASSGDVANGFRIERAPDAGDGPGAWSELITLLATNTRIATYTDTNVLATNWYRVRAFNVLGSSPYSDAARVDVVPPPAPVYFYVNAFGDRFDLSWNFYDNSGIINGFKIERAVDVGGSPGSWVPLATIAVSNRYDSSFTYTDPHHAVNTTYWYRVRAFNWVGDGEYSPTVSATIVPPAAPTDLYGQIGITNHQVVLLWNEYPADEDGFRVEKAPNQGGSPGSWTQIATVLATNAGNATYTDVNVTALTNWYRIRAFNGQGVSSYSEAVPVRVVPPPAPYYLSANVFRDQINLYWNFDSSYGAVKGFKIERAPDVGGNPGAWVPIANTTSDINNFTDVNRAVNKTYWYRVRAFNWVGNGDYSPLASATIVPPAAPTSLVGEIGPTNHQVNLSWYEYSADQNGFQIERAADTGGNPGAWSKIGTLLTTDSYASFIDTNARAGTTNWYRVRAYNGLGISSYSVARVPIVPPPAPNSLTANTFRDQISLSWPYDYFNYGTVDGFKIERAPDIGGSPGAWAQIASVNAITYADTNRPPGVTYWYRVRAFNWVGDGGYSPTASATITPPAAPTALTGLIGATNQANLSWNEWPADEDGFKVERAPDDGGSPGVWTEIATLLTTNSGYVEYIDTNVMALTTNWYRVRAFNALGTSPYSQAASVQTVPPPAADNLFASAFRDQITLSWYSHEYYYWVLAGFEIERAPDVAGSPGTWTRIVSTTGIHYYNNYTDTNLAAGVTYWYRIRAYNWAGASDYSPTASATIVPLAAPTVPYARIGITNQVNLSLNESSADEDGFRIERAPDAGGNPGSWIEIGTLLATNTNFAIYTDTNVTALATNWYRVRAFNNLGTSPYSEAASIQIVPPAAPDFLSANVFRDQVILAWVADYNNYGTVDGFKIERAPDVDGSPGAWAQIASVVNIYYNNNHYYTDTNQTAGATYWYRVRAFNWVGNGDYSAMASTTIVPPATPASLYGQIGATNHQVNLFWNDWPADEDGFKVERAPDAGGSPGTWTEIGTVLATNTSYAGYTDTNVTALTTNWYRVRAFNDLGTSSYSDAARVQIVPPPAPIYLSISVFRDQINLYWFFDYSYGAVNGFKIERAPDVGGNPGVWAQIATTTSDSNSYTDVNRAVNKTYWYRVRAFNWVGNGDYSQTVSATIMPPAAPTNLAGQVGPTNHSVNLSWSESSADENGFQIERAPDTGGIPGAWTRIGTLLATNISNANYTDTNATAFTTVWYRVRAFNALGTSSNSEAVQVLVVPPAAPNYFSASVLRDQVNLSWVADYTYGAVDGFKIERAPDVSGSPGTWTQIASIASSYYFNGYTDSNRTAGATFWYRVRGFNWVGNGNYSLLASATIVPPAAPLYVNGQIGTTNQVNLSWYESPADEDGFRVERAPDSGGSPGPWTEIGTLLATNITFASYTDTNVTALTTNWYRVRTFNSLGTSSYSETAAVHVVPPPTPNYLSAYAFRDQVNLSWIGYYYNYGVVDGYKIERAPDVGGSPGAWAQIARVDNSSYGYTDTNRTLGATYWYRVRAFNWVGDGDYSQTASATITPPAAPVHLNGQIGTTNQVNLSWSEFSVDQDGFRIERSPDGGGSPGAWTEIGTVLAANIGYASYTDTNVTALTTNWYRVRAFNNLGTSAYSQAASVHVVPPGPPAYFYASPSGAQIYLTWSFYNYGVLNGIKVERAPDVSGSPGAWTQIASVADSYYNGYPDTNVIAGTTYWYRVRGFTWVGDGDYSPTASATIVVLPGATATLNQVRFISLIPTNSDVLVIWQTMGGTTNTIEAASSLAEGFTNLSGALPIGGSGLIETNYLDAGALTNAVQRFYRVKLQ